ncbi:hypothetical protein R50072_04500 [Simiduia litorea]|uniref:phosphate ABC transporter substrate-binding protein n=1 Tax=Simiduia litorea TaxID=1435348 RepID=UPI0036F35E84
MKKIICAGLLSASTICQAEVAVIVHPSNSNNMDATGITHLFLGKAKAFPDGSTAIPINQPESSSSSAEFMDKVLNKSASQLKAYWSKLLFTGQGTPPKEVNSDADVLKLVAENPNTIGYIDANNVTANVKVAAKF